MFKILKNNNIIIYFSFFIILCATILRLYNLNFENLWFDEIVTFWISDPKLSFTESYERQNIAEGTPFLFNFLIKILHIIFGYNPNVGRYLSFTVSVLSIFSMVYLAKSIKKNNSYLFIIFLTGFNIFLIKYSQELRAYSLIFFLSSVSLIFYFRMLKKDIEEKYFSKNSFYFIIFQILSILSHPFTMIVFGSIILYTMTRYIFKKNLNKLLNTSILVISIFIIIYFPYYLISTDPVLTSWIKHPSAQFYTNYYFSKFFGSRILGMTYFLILFFLIFKFRKKFINNLEPSTTLIFIIFFSYFIPIVFGYLYMPILVPRYIIFVLIPITTLISYLVYELKDKKIRRSLIFIIIFLTLGNLSTETTIQQFFKERPSHKPQYVSALEYINKSNHKDFTISMSFTDRNRNLFNKAMNNYFYKIIEKNKLNIKSIEIGKVEIGNYVWFICLADLITSSCSEINNKFNVLEEKNYNSTNLKLVKFSK
tara:strand:+ start:600 stop:2042 length:1443 start_codon:yes stop_codon:yes gene_type:complete